MTTPEKFEFLNPLDGKTYSLPPYNPELFVDKVDEHKDTIPEAPSPWDLLHLSPAEQQRVIDEQSRQVSLLRTMTVVETLDAHLPDADDPAKAAIIANVNALDFAFIYKVYAEWVAASGAEVKADLGEG